MVDCHGWLSHAFGWLEIHITSWSSRIWMGKNNSFQPTKIYYRCVCVYIYIYYVYIYIILKRPGHGSRLDPTTAKTAPLSRLSHECLRPSPHLKETQGHMTPVRWRMGAAFKLPVIWKTTNKKQKQNKQQAPKATRTQTTTVGRPVHARPTWFVTFAESEVWLVEQEVS